MQNFNLKTTNKQQISKMHLGCKNIVKKIGGIVEMDDSQNQLQIYICQNL
jgi:hypothetical protein